MKLHEYQAKALLADSGLPLPAGRVAKTPAEAAEAARTLGGKEWVVKAQIQAGGRGKAGGVRRASTPEAVAREAEALLGRRLVTEQTGPEGRSVKQVYVEQAEEAGRDLYLALLVERTHGRVAFLASAAGGEDIEAAVQQDPGRIHTLPVDTKRGLDREALVELAGKLAIESVAVEAFVDLAGTLHRVFWETDAGLIEINPLKLRDDGSFLALDVKMVLDDNALFRHEDLAALRDRDELDPQELEAALYELNYVKLEGDIGCVVNGAGLALATLDILKQSGGEPADFMDIRPVATRDQVATGIAMLLRNPNVRTLLVNVYGGGILRCDTVAEGLAIACREIDRKLPLVVRFAGTNREIARQVLTNQGVAVDYAQSLDEAAEKAIKAARREAA